MGVLLLDVCNQCNDAMMMGVVHKYSVKYELGKFRLLLIKLKTLPAPTNNKRQVTNTLLLRTVNSISQFYYSIVKQQEYSTKEYTQGAETATALKTATVSDIIFTFT